MQIPAGKKIFFLSDFHLGAPDATKSLEREKLIVQFLDEIKQQMVIGHGMVAKRFESYKSDDRFIIFAS